MTATKPIVESCPLIKSADDSLQHFADDVVIWLRDVAIEELVE